MIEVTVIVGLPGSGKTHLAERLRDDQTTVIDDLSRDPSRLERFVQHPTKKLIITDPTYLSAEFIRKKMAEWIDRPHVVQIIAFTNEPQQCFQNVRTRADGRDISYEYIKSLSLRYNPDQYDQVEPVFTP